jgi:hypothetical protein
MQVIFYIMVKIVGEERKNNKWESNQIQIILSTK